MELAPTGDFIAKTIRSDFEGDVGLEFFLETFGDLTGGSEVAFLTF